MDKEEKKEVVEPKVEEVDKVNKNAIATIHNNLIQARHRLSLEEIRLMDTIISFIQPEDDDLKKYKIPVSIFKELYGTKRKDVYDVVKRAVEGLLSKPIKIEGVNDKGKKVFKMFNFISYGEYEEGAGSFYISIDRNFKPYLLQLKEFFTRIPIKYTYVLHSRYSIRLYELLKQYENTGFRVDYLPDLREMLGIEPEEYKRFEAFERIVLKRAVKEINEKTDIEVSYEKKKTGRRITHIEFKIKPKSVIKGDTTQEKKTPSESVDIQRQEKEKNEDLSVVDTQPENNFASVWEDIGKIRKEYREILDRILPEVSRLNENQILFLLINADKNQFTPDILKEVIISTDNNQAVNNPMGFLIESLGIDIKQAKFKELTLILSKVDEALFREKLKNMFVEGKPAKEYFTAYWDRVIKPAYEKGLMGDGTLKLLREPLRLAIYDEIDKVIYIPVPDVIYKEWFENNFLESIKDFLDRNFNIEDIKVEVVDF